MMIDNVKLFEDAVIRQQINQAWEDVFKTSSQVIRQSGLYGFYGMELIPNPNIHQMLKSLKIVSGMVAEIIEDLADADVDPDHARLVINAQEQIWRLERVAGALISGDREAYEKQIAELKRQAQF